VQNYYKKHAYYFIACHTRARGWRSGVGTHKLGRAKNFQIPAKLFASIHPDLHQTVCLHAAYFHVS